MLKLIKMGNANAVYLNTDTNEYELWVVSGSKLIEQDDVFTNEDDAIDCLDFMDREFERFFSDSYDDDFDFDFEDDITNEDLTEWQAASSGCGYYAFIGKPWLDD